MITYNGRYTLSDYEKEELKQAIMEIPEKYRMNRNTIIIPCSECTQILWGDNEFLYPLDSLCITGKTAEVLTCIIIGKKSKMERYDVILSDFLEEYYHELYEQISK